MRVLDLFSGTGSATQPFADREHDVFRVELDEKFDADLHADVLDLGPFDWFALWRAGPYDFVWASPPCTSFSVGSFRHHWKATATCRTCGGGLLRASGEKWVHNMQRNEDTCAGARPDELHYYPKSDTGKLGHELLIATLNLIKYVEPRWWIIENPRALMRKMPELEGVERRTITHCQYGDPRRMKPTDLFGVFPDGFEARSCAADRHAVVEVDGVEYRPAPDGSPCHEAASRGAKTGTQGLDKTESAMLPPDLGLELCLAMEQEVTG